MNAHCPALPALAGEPSSRIAVPAADGSLPAEPAGRLRALSQSAWIPVVARAAAIAFGMALLAAFGAVSMAKSLEGVSLGGKEIDARLGAAWMAPAPSPQEPAPAPAASDAGARAEETCDGPDGGGVTNDGKVILNTADVRDLTRLPGVGQRRAEEIVALRNRLKKFRRITDLLRVRGIGVRSLKRMKPHLVLDPPADVADGGKGG